MSVQAVGLDTSTVGPVEKTPKYKQKLAEFIELLKANKINLVILIEDGVAYELELNRKGKKLIVNFKHISEDRIHQLTKDKVDVYHRTGKVWVGTFSTVGTVACLFAPSFNIFSLSAQMAQMAQSGISTATNVSNELLTNRDNSDHTGIDYVTTSNKDLVQGHQSRLSQLGQNFGQSEQINEKVRTMLETLFSRLYSSGS